MDSVQEKTAKAVAPYTAPFLSIYDMWVLQLSNRFAWRCPTQRMLGMYDTNIGARHLEVGPGSGWYLTHASFPVDRPQITLLDLNPTVLGFVERRLGDRADVAAVVGSVLEPVPAAAGDGYDSIGLNYVLHCVPGDFTEKGAALQHLARVLADDGVLFGSTVLGRDRPLKNLFGRALQEGYNRVGAFHNRGDDRDGLAAALGQAFADVQLRDVGDVTMFVARTPIRTA